MMAPLNKTYILFTVKDGSRDEESNGSRNSNMTIESNWIGTCWTLFSKGEPINQIKLEKRSSTFRNVPGHWHYF